MLEIALAALVSAAVTGPGPTLGTSYQPRMIGGRQLASMPPYPAGRADDVRRPGFNGRLWIGRPIIGGRDNEYPLGWGSPGPAAYGASETDFREAYARVNTMVVAVSPWVSIPVGGLGDLEAARNEWLKEQGYVGGVRTFINDAYLPRELTQGEAPGARRAITPRATIQVPADMPSFRSRQQVMQLRPGDRVSVPGGASPAMVARIQSVTAARVAGR